MGLSPDQVLAMPLHDYQAAIYHLNRDRSGDEDEDMALSDDEFEEMQVAMSIEGIH